MLVLLLSFSGCRFNYNLGQKVPQNKSNQVENTKKDVSQFIKEAFQDKYPEWDMNKVKIEVGDSTDKHASGGVSFIDEPGGAWWLAAKVKNKWQVVADGNGTVSCTEIEPYDFPVEMAPYCYDDDLKQMIDRQTGEPEVTAEEGIQKALETYHDAPNDKIVNFIIDDQTDTLAKGSVTYQSEVGGWWLANKEDGQWSIITTGSDVVDCDLIEPYDFPGGMVNVCYDYKNNQVINRVGKEDLDNILEQVANHTGINFGLKENVNFDWMESAGKSSIVGRGMTVKKTDGANLSEIEEYFDNYGFVIDQYNVASGTVAGLEGYARDVIVCQIYQTMSGGEQAMQQGKNDLDIEVRCGTI